MPKSLDKIAISKYKEQDLTLSRVIKLGVTQSRVAVNIISLAFYQFVSYSLFKRFPGKQTVSVVNLRLDHVQTRSNHVGTCLNMFINI